MNSKQEGSITVFLSLIIVLLLAIVATTVETTRIHIARLHIERSLNSAMHSVLAEFDSNLLDEYGIITLDATYGSNEIDTSLMSDRVNYYLQHSFQPQKDLKESNVFFSLINNSINNGNYLDLYGLNVKDIEIYNLTSIVDKNTEIFKYQILEDMKFRGPGIVVEEFLGKLNLVSKASKTAEVIQNKAELDTKVEQVGKTYIRLMELIDGIEFIHNSIDFYNNKVSIAPYYVKKLNSNYISWDTITNNPQINESFKGELYQIGNEGLYSEIQNLLQGKTNYYNLKRDIGNLQREISRKEEEITNIEEEKRMEEKNLNDLWDVLDELEMEDENYKVTMQQIGELEDIVENYKEDIKDLESDISKNHDEIDRIDRRILEEEKIFEKGTDNVIEELDKITNVLFRIRNINDEALQEIGSINNNIIDLQIEIIDYEIELDNNKDELIEETYDALKKDIKELKSQLQIENNSMPLNTFNNIAAMEEILNYNLNLLNQDKIRELNFYKSDEFFNEIDIRAEEIVARNTLVQNWESEINNIKYVRELKNYIEHFNEYGKDSDRYLQFDYSDFNFNKIDKEARASDPRSNDNITNKDKILEAIDLTADEMKLIEVDKLPSGVASGIEINNENISFKNTKFTSQVLDMLKGYSSGISSKIREMPKDLLVNEYIVGNFQSAINHLEDADNLSLKNYDMSNHYLDYEVEYIIEGNLDEVLNLKSVSSKIIGVRFGLNLIHVLSDPVKRQMTLNMATAIIGWTPLGFLIYIAQFLIMCAWSYAESYIDLMLLLQGKSVAFIKTRNDWVLDERGIKSFALDLVTNKATEIVNQTTDKTIEKAIDLVDEFSTYLDDELKEYATSTIAGIFDDGYRMGEEAKDFIDRQVDEIIDTHILALVNNTEMPNIDLEIIYDDNGSDLVKDIISSINENKNGLLDYSVIHLLNFKNDIYNELDLMIEQSKNHIAKSIESAITSTMEDIKGMINTQISSVGEKAGSFAKDVIDDLNKEIKNKLGINITDSVKKNIATNGEKELLGKINIKFSYEDYLRLFLLFNVNERDKLLRTMDCIQMNMYAIRGDDFLLRQQIFSFDAKVIVEMDYLFFNLPFMPSGIKNFGSQKHTITVNYSQSY
ncbi:hypothetical protein EDC18_1168 [Natranaerovirga pectinivora]|uniref:Uncharacterized protein n=1 Tax=Natranaerovirga pectinivora TaxID=682400 RepID=A0A4R3MH04_9FIRM|nr:DUF5702 domain-containing protein [Natranaerovirga pectinivora]TCT11649.1 hypothetical protein EDC18_1168 [Natranaerovirga pectinivora]